MGTAPTAGMVDMVEAAARARVGYHVMHGWVLRGFIDGERRLGRWVVKEQSLEAFITARGNDSGMPRSAGESGGVPRG
jgi:hypothetical protein